MEVCPSHTSSLLSPASSKNIPLLLLHTCIAGQLQTPQPSALMQCVQSFTPCKIVVLPFKPAITLSSALWRSAFSQEKAEFWDFKVEHSISILFSISGQLATAHAMACASFGQRVFQTSTANDKHYAYCNVRSDRDKNKFRLYASVRHCVSGKEHRMGHCHGK